MLDIIRSVCMCVLVAAGLVTGYILGIIWCGVLLGVPSGDISASRWPTKWELTQSIVIYDDPEVATLIVDANCDELVKSLDPLSFALVLVSRGLTSKQQARGILNDRAENKTRSERNLAFLNLVKSSSDPTWLSALLEALGEERTTERLKEVLEKSE